MNAHTRAPRSSWTARTCARITRVAMRALVLCFVALLLLADPAAAAPNCGNDPVRDDPAASVTSDIDPGVTNPRAGDPFAKDTQVSIYEVYGPGAPRWANWDDGCDPRTDAARGFATDVANGAMSALTFSVAVVVGILRLAFNPALLGALAPVQMVAATSFGQSIFYPMLPWALGALAVIAAWASRRQAAVAQNASRAFWALGMTALGLAALALPLSIAPKVDNAITGLVSQVNASAAAAAGEGSTGDLASDMGALLQRSIVYPTWCAGYLGRFGGDAAERYCPALWDASRYTAAERATIAADPGARAGIEDAKNAKFAEAASAIQRDYPGLYPGLNGASNGNRYLVIFLGGVALLCSSLFLTWAALLIVYALLVLRVGWMVTPVLALVGVLHRKPVLKVADYVAGVLLSAALFGSIAVVAVAALAAFVSPASNLNPFVAAVVMGVFTVAVLVVTGPTRAIRAVGIRLKSQAAAARKKLGETGKGSFDQDAFEEAERAREAAVRQRSAGAALRRVATSGATAAVTGLISGGTSAAASAVLGAYRSRAANAGAATPAEAPAPAPPASTPPPPPAGPAVAVAPAPAAVGPGAAGPSQPSQAHTGRIFDPREAPAAPMAPNRGTTDSPVYDVTSMPRFDPRTVDTDADAEAGTR